jgi:hypothetical protein
MTQKLNGEHWEKADFRYSLPKKYAISNKERLVSFTTNLFKDGNLLKNSIKQTYKIMRYSVTSREKKHFEFTFFHRLVAIHCCKQKSPAYNKVIFKDYNRKNVDVTKLKWVMINELYHHSIESPVY